MTALKISNGALGLMLVVTAISAINLRYDNRSLRSQLSLSNRSEKGFIIRDYQFSGFPGDTPMLTITSGANLYLNNVEMTAGVDTGCGIAVAPHTTMTISGMIVAKNAQ